MGPVWSRFSLSPCCNWTDIEIQVPLISQKYNSEWGFQDKNYSIWRHWQCGGSYGFTCSTSFLTSFSCAFLYCGGWKNKNEFPRLPCSQCFRCDLGSINQKLPCKTWIWNWVNRERGRACSISFCWCGSRRDSVIKQLPKLWGFVGLPGNGGGSFSDHSGDWRILETGSFFLWAQLIACLSCSSNGPYASWHLVIDPFLPNLVWGISLLCSWILVYNSRLYTAGCQGNGNPRLLAWHSCIWREVKIQLAGRLEPWGNGLLKASFGRPAVRSDNLVERAWGIRALWGVSTISNCTTVQFQERKW